MFVLSVRCVGINGVVVNVCCLLSGTIVRFCVYRRFALVTMCFVVVLFTYRFVLFSLSLVVCCLLFLINKKMCDVDLICMFCCVLCIL